MSLRDLRKTGHWPTLLCSLLFFGISFMVWMLPGALGNSLAKEFGLSDFQKGLMVAVPILGGALLRPVVGWFTDRAGAKNAVLGGLVLTTIPLLLAWLWVQEFGQLLAVVFLLGIAGASFASALPLASRWYPASLQGLVLGVAGAGNCGTAFATLLAPRLAPAVGWRGVFGLALLVVAAVFVIVVAIAKQPPQPKRQPGDPTALAILARPDAYWLSLFYAVTFGGFVGLCSFLSLFFRDQYGVDPIKAGMLATIAGLVGALIRPLGGWLSDRFGGVRVLLALYCGLAACALVMAGLPSLAVASVVLTVILAILGLGNGAVFQIVPQRFPRELGVATGVIGAAGGLGGFFLPLTLGSVRQATGSFSFGFALIGLVAVGATLGLTVVNKQWQRKAEAVPDDPSAIEPLPALLMNRGVGAEADV